MEWTRSEAIALAKENCVHCRGYGLRASRRAKPNPCNCVLRAIFRPCYARFRYCMQKEKYLSKVTFNFSDGKDRRMTWSRKDEEYIADFCLVSHRTLDEFEHRIFRFHFLLGADWKLCCRRMKIDRGTFFHAVYRIEQKLGRVFRELEPYSLFPLDEYFGGTTRRERVTPPPNKVIMMPPRQSSTLRLPLQKIA